MTFGAQAAVPIVAAVAEHGAVCYAEVVTSMASSAADAAARAGVDQFIENTAAAVESATGAQRCKAVLLLTPAEPPTPLRQTVYCLVDGDVDRAQIEAEIEASARNARGYRLRQRVQFETFGASNPLYIPETGAFVGTRVTVLLEVTARSRETAGAAT